MGRCTKMLVFTAILVLSLQQTWGFRLLKEKQLLWQQNKLIIQSLQRGPVQGSQRNPCSTVPGRSHGRCTFETTVAPAPPTLPQVAT
ncbi:hypothetical protein VIGAN_08160700 [Vigna angularis var. angularis]|uniref:Uncharacterized protein n=1 Tax=Vigna angularis var. angularis TaxID=157739 RepID=A0A0S3SQA3_PHAAN|nr:hypothetical protein VIGAN_08160700 [Vigna angularis var. angularis]